jgi:hypothetical protein
VNTFLAVAFGARDRRRVLLIVTAILVAFIATVVVVHCLRVANAL